jgi:hypothetical protein
MRFELKTLIDITETGARRGEDHKKYLQQQNFYTTLQTISLRANPIMDKSPTSSVCNIDSIGFGSAYKGEHQVWSWQFRFEQADSHNLDFLKNDFNLVPIILELEETVKINNAAFVTLDDDYKNIVFFRDIDK